MTRRLGSYAASLPVRPVAEQVTSAAQPRFTGWGNRLHLSRGGASMILWPYLIYHMVILITDHY